MILKILMPLCLSVLFVLSANPQSQYAPEPKQVEDVHEVVFRHFFTHDLAVESRSLLHILCEVSPQKFVSRFADNDPPVVWLSECPFGPSRSEPLGKKKEPAERIGITKVRWISAVEVRVKAYCRYGELGYTQQLLHLVHKNGNWIVSSVETEVFS